MAGNTHIKENSVNILLVNMGANPTPRTFRESTKFTEWLFARALNVETLDQPHHGSYRLSFSVRGIKEECESIDRCWPVSA